MTIADPARAGSHPPAAPPSGVNDALLRRLATSSRPLATAIERLQAMRSPFGAKPGVYALQETTADARPALLAAMHRAMGGTVLVVVPTPDVAERAFADLLYYLGEDEPQTAVLLGARDEALGAIQSPSERSARMTVLADLIDGTPRIVLAPIRAVRQYLMPRALFDELRFCLRPGDEAGWEATQERLYRLGYERSDLVSAVGEYAVRGGILDVYPATAGAPMRVEFFGDTVESVRRFEVESQRSNASVASVEVVPWTEIPRDEHFRARILERFDGSDGARHELATHLNSREEVPETWLPLAFDQRATIFDYVPAGTLLVLDEPATISTVATALDEERTREQHVLQAALGSGELSVDETEVGEALLADVAAVHPSLEELGRAMARFPTLAVSGAIENATASSWIAPPIETFALACRPAEHFNRQIELFSRSVRDAVAAGETTVVVSAAVARTTDLLQAAGVPTAPRPTPGAATVDHGSIEAGFAVPSLRLRVLGDREIYGTPAKRVKMRAVKEGVPVTLADLRVGDHVVHAVHGLG
ncbi:MAG: hypothetical protein WB615_10405, partial [Candidatus Tumulicola sp.]